MDPEKPRPCGMTRRRMLGATGAAGAVAAGAGACSSTNEPQPQDSLRGTVVAQTSDVPQGSGTVLVDDKLVLTQPEQGEFQAYSAVCTHAGCTIQEVTERIRCLCHGSEFDIATGEVVAGPANDPLEKFTVSVDGTDITLED
ncbi:secreted protein [Haloactinospora alba]|uniref:Cytochrome bc1 complex Rieske iron-sulfur subunit n=2 Tax=Haloactinospora alba TaxID=405555 RepID=A0A543NHN9_9ACTN|nr:secreted protein [Haloactinospora alba]